MRLLLTCFSLLCSMANAASPTLAPPESWFLVDHILTLKRAEEVVEMTREHFWTHAKLPNGQPITPMNDAERSTGPIERMDALYFAQAAQLAGMAEWCGLDPTPYTKHALNRAWEHYGDIRQIIFASMLFGSVARDIKQRRSAQGECSTTDREATERTIKFVMERSNPAVQGTLRAREREKAAGRQRSNPAVQGTLRDKAAQRP